MNKNNIIYWASTTVVAAMMLMSAYAYFMVPDVATMMDKSFPKFFRLELGTAKILGALVLLIPQVPLRVKEWAYAGFGIVFISACVFHLSINDAKGALMPVVLLALLVVSNLFLHKNKAEAAV